MFNHVFISPHLDDAVYSAGGTISNLVAAGEEVAVLTVFAAEPPEELSPFAQGLHDRWELGNQTQVRQKEDLEALAILDVAAIQLELFDCIYRQANGEWLYETEASLTGNIANADQELIEQICDAISGMPDMGTHTKIYGPLAIGNHVDHQVTHAAIKVLGKYQRLYYEDFPHTEKALFNKSGWRQVKQSVSEKDIDAKVAAMAAHASQISTFWDSKEDMESKVRARWEKQGRSEVFWATAS